jgi:hypothetical protein
MKGTRFWALSPPPIDGCPILRALCEGWDSQISPFNLTFKADLFLRRSGFLLTNGLYRLRKILVLYQGTTLVGPQTLENYVGLQSLLRNSVLEEGHGFSRAVNDTAIPGLSR